MQLSDKPNKLVLPFAASGAKNTIPAASQIGIVAGKASLTDGFPPLTRTPIAAGGVPPSGLDMNGILYEMSAIIRWANAGGGYPFDSAFATDTNVGGYPKGARVMRSDGTGYWFNTAENNVTDPNDAGAAAAGWVPDFTTGVAAVTMTSSSVTLTPVQYGKPIIAITGLLTANLNLIFPTMVGEWVVINNTTGAFTITAKTSGGTGVTLNHSVPNAIAGDGVNIYATNPFQFVSVKSYGAVGDGVTDDAAAINAAIVYVNSKGGGTVFFPSGVYRVKSSVKYLAGADLIGESMGNTTLKWYPDTNTTGSILDTSNQYLNRARFENLRFTKDASITANTTGILGGSTLANYNSGVGCFENLHFDLLTYGIRGNAEPTGVGIFDCYFKNIWCSGCFYGLWLFGSASRVDHPRMTSCDTAIALDCLNAESCDSMTITGGIFVQNGYDIGVMSASGIRPTKIIGTWFEQSANGIIDVKNANSRVMNLDFIGCQLSTSSTVSLFNAANAVGTVSIDRCTLISGGVDKAQNFVRPTAPGGRLIVKDCQKYDAAGVAAFVSDDNYFDAVKSGVDQSIPPSTYTKLVWASAVLDSAGGFDNANDTYVIPAKGTYKISASVGFSAHSVSTNSNRVLVYKNNSFQRTFIGASNSTAETSVFGSCLLPCNAGDTIDIRVFHNNASNINVLGVNDLTHFTVEYVTP